MCGLSIHVYICIDRYIINIPEDININLFILIFMLQKLQTIAEDFCGLDVNTPLGGQEPMTAVPVLTFTKLLTAVAATSTGDYTVVFIGTSNGHLKKVR